MNLHSHSSPAARRFPMIALALAVVLIATVAAIGVGPLGRGGLTGAATPGTTDRASVRPTAFAPSPGQTEPLRELEAAFAAVAEQVAPSVVTLEVRRPVRRATPRQPEPPFRFPFPFPNPFEERSPEEAPAPRLAPAAGSGVIVRQQGNTVYLLTNAHVVRDAERITVTLHDGRRFTGEVVGIDDKTDLAVVKITPPAPLPAHFLARLGDSQNVRVGQWAIAIGNPLGYDFTLTVGVISATGRTLVSPESISLTDLIQTDASINPGNSGGPLVNIAGEVIGINTAIASSPGRAGSIGIGFAIPVNTAKAVIEPLIREGKVTRGWLGVVSSMANRTLPPELQTHYGVQEGALVEDVLPDGPAGRAGLRPEDVVVRFGNQPIRSFGDLEKAVAATRPGTRVGVVVVREQKRQTIQVTIGERPDEATLAQGRRPGGDRERPEDVETRFGFTVRAGEGGRGVQVAGVTPDSPAAQAGLAPGDVIERVGQSTITDLASFRRAIGAARTDRPLVLRVRSVQTGARSVRVLRP